MRQQFLDELQQIAGAENLRRMEPMSRHTTFRVGGPADAMVWPQGAQLAQVIRLCRRYEEDFYILGNGSNLLVGDRGIRGLVIAMTKASERLAADGDAVFAGAGVLLSKTAGYAAAQGLSGMEFAGGIPGTVGGAVVMNAGAYGGEMRDIICGVTVLDVEGNEKRLGAEELGFGYRKSCIPANSYIVTEARFKLVPGDEDAVRAKMRELNGKRLQKQPLEFPSAGSTFKRPEGYFAGKLIMDAGLRGYRVGGAQISEKHCGFVINTGGATAADIVRLMQDVSEEVRKQFGVTLEPEVKLIGEF